MTLTTPTPSTDPAGDFRNEWLQLLRDELETIRTTRIVAATYRSGAALDEAQAGIDAEDSECWSQVAEALTSGKR